MGFNSQKTSVKVAIVAGVSAIVAAIIPGIFSLIENHSSTPQQVTPSHSSVAPTELPQPDPSRSSVAPTIIPTSAQPAVPINFIEPRKGESLGQQISVELTGTVPSGEHLWIFVYSSGEYYVQSAPDWQPPYWVSSVYLGANGPADVNALYTIYAVLADTQANVAIQSDIDTTGGNTGTLSVPGGNGAKKVGYITVNRSH